MKHKLIQYDLSRGRIPKTETIVKHVDLLKNYGLTGIILYMECVVENKIFPACGCGSTPVTNEYISKLNTYMAEQKMELVPLLQVLGHQENLFKQPGMSKYSEFESGGAAFRIDSPEARKTVKQWLAEIVPLFNSDYVHIGGDEAFNIGLGKSRQFVSKNGFEEAIADYLNDICSFLKRLGKKMVMYADLIIHYPQVRELLDKDIIICNWGYGTKTEVYEQENHNFAMHEYVSAKHANWVCGNNMAEYIITPFQRLKENTSVWLELGAKSGAECFIISDWGSYENVNPFSLSLLGDIYILKRLDGATFSFEGLLDELSQLAFGKNNNDFKSALRIMLKAQKNPQYFGNRLKDWSPVFPTLFLADPDSKDLIRTCACFELDGLIKFEQDARKAYGLMSSITDSIIPEVLDEFKALSRRLLVIALRTRLCFEHTWYSGAVWIEKHDIAPAKDILAEYNRLAQEDLNWDMDKWDMDNQESCREKCREYLSEAIISTVKTIHIPENSMLYYPPKKIKGKK